jgi:uncharacterized Zn finger protein
LRENAAAKGRRYLTEGRVIVTHVRPGTVVRAVVRGDGALHRCGWDAGTWWCQCPARSDACAHLVALRLIVAVDLGNAP